MEDIRCIFCGIDNDRVVIEEKGFQGRKCARCGLVYISPRPTFDEILNIYGHDQAHVPAEAHLSGEFAKRLYARHNLSLIKKYVRRGAILDIGAGAGFFLDEARRAGFDPFAIEFNPAQADFIDDTLKIPCAREPLSPTLFDGRKFDVIYHCDVISHFYDPIAEFKKMHAQLNEGGWVIFETGNIGDIDLKHYRHFEKFQYPDHLFFFGEDNLKQLLEMTGFEFAGIHRYSILPLLASEKMMAGLKGAVQKPPQRRDAPAGAETGHVEPGQREQKPSSETSERRKDSLAIRTIKIAYYCYLYFLRYQVGAIAPKHRRPQTILVAARKKIVSQ